MGRLLALLPLSVLLAACGGSTTKSSSAPPASGPVRQTIQIGETEYKLTPSSVKLSATGTYAFKATNNGSIAHALEIEGNGVEEKTADIQPGSSATLKVTLSKTGSYDFYCPIDGHRGQGMSGTITVGSAPSSGGGMTTTQPATTTSGRPGY